MEEGSAMFQHLVESLPRRVEAVIAAKGGTNSILMPMILERDVRRAGVHILLVMSVYVCGYRVSARESMQVIRVAIWLAI